MEQGTIFISYRRDDTSGFTRAVQDQLAQRFSKDRVFMDVDAIEPGLRFDQVIDEAVGRCKVVLVMIGKHWLDIQPPAGTPRLHDPHDSVRIEIAAALSRDIRVIPVLVDGATMPAAEALPEPLRPLALRNAIEVSNTRFEGDVGRLGDVIAKVIGPLAKPATPWRRPWAYSFAAAVVGLALLTGVYLYGKTADSCVWNLAGEWTLKQTIGPRVFLSLRQEGRQLTGSASAETSQSSEDIAIRNGTIDADKVGFVVPWRTGASRPSTGVYQGIVDAEGNLTGTTWDQMNPSVRATWEANRPATPCAR